MPQEPDIEAVVRGMTQAQRKAVLSGRQPEGMGKWPVQNALVEKGLAEYFPWRFTPFGQRVAAYLKEQSNAG